MRHDLLHTLTKIGGCELKIPDFFSKTFQNSPNELDFFVGSNWDTELETRKPAVQQGDTISLFVLALSFKDCSLSIHFWWKVFIVPSMVSAFDDLRFSGGKYSHLKVLTIPICDAIHTNPSAQHVCACEPNVGLRHLMAKPTQDASGRNDERLDQIAKWSSVFYVWHRFWFQISMIFSTYNLLW